MRAKTFYSVGERCRCCSGPIFTSLPYDYFCSECKRSPAKLVVGDRRLCGVCWHRVSVINDLIARVRASRREDMGGGDVSTDTSDSS